MWSKRKMSSCTLAKFVCERPRKTYDNLLNIYPTLTLGPVILWFLYLYHSVNYTNARKCCEAIPQIPGKWRHLSWPLFQSYSMAAPRPHPPPTPRFCTDSVPSQIFSPFILLQNYENYRQNIMTYFHGKWCPEESLTVPDFTISVVFFSIWNYLFFCLILAPFLSHSTHFYT